MGNAEPSAEFDRFCHFTASYGFSRGDSLRESLTAFGKRLETRLDELRSVKDKGGQPEKTGLRIWTARARDFWEEHWAANSRINTSMEFHKGEAFAFCFFVLQRIAPDVTEKALATAMRAMIKPMKVTFRHLPPREPQ